MGYRFSLFRIHFLFKDRFHSVFRFSGFCNDHAHVELRNRAGIDRAVFSPYSHRGAKKTKGGSQKGIARLRGLPKSARWLPRDTHTRASRRERFFFSRRRDTLWAGNANF